MAWTTPLTAVANAALTAAQWNASVRDNLLETVPAKATQSGSYFTGTGVGTIAERIPVAEFVSATETTATTTFTNLTTAGPAVTATSGTRVLLMISASMSNSTVNADSFMGVEISGSHTASATDSNSLIHTSATANARVNATWLALYPVTAGTSTYTAKYRAGSGTGSWGVRRVTVLPF